MNPTLDIFHKILTGSLKPWVKGNITNEQFKVRTAELVEISPTYPEKFTLKFIKPFSSKTKYYAFEIHNSVTRYMNELTDHFLNNDSENIKTNLIHHALKKELSPILEKISTIIEQEDYRPDYIDIANLKKTASELKENTFIFHLLKAHAIRLYLETEDLGRSYLKTEYLELDDIHYQFFNDIVPAFYTIDKIKDAPEIVIPVLSSQKVIKPEENGFKPIKYDIQNVKPSKIDYTNIRNENEFAKVEEALHGQGIIDTDYFFIKNKKESNSRNLAAIIRVLIDNNYFRRNILQSIKQATDNDIREYLENRYSTDVKQQFRRLASQHVEAIKSKYRWVDQIKPLR